MIELRDISRLNVTLKIKDLCPTISDDLESLVSYEDWTKEDNPEVLKSLVVLINLIIENKKMLSSGDFFYLYHALIVILNQLDYMTSFWIQIILNNEFEDVDVNFSENLILAAIKIINDNEVLETNLNITLSTPKDALLFLNRVNVLYEIMTLSPVITKNRMETILNIIEEIEKSGENHGE